MKADALAARAVTDPAAYEQHTQLARDIAVVLRRNVVQAVKVTDSVSTSKDDVRDKWSKFNSLSKDNSPVIPYHRAANNKRYGAGVERHDKKPCNSTIKQERAGKGGKQPTTTNVCSHIVSFSPTLRLG